MKGKQPNGNISSCAFRQEPTLPPPKLLRVCRWKSQGSCYDWSVSCTGFVAEDLWCLQEGLAHNSFWYGNLCVYAIGEQMLQSWCAEQIHPSTHCFFPAPGMISEELPSFLQTRAILYPNFSFGSEWLSKWFLQMEKQEMEGSNLRCELC